MRHWMLSLVLAWTSLWPVCSFALSEQELKVALLLKVAKFTSWPDRSDQQFRFCLYKGKGYERLLESTVAAPSINNMPVHFVFIDENSKGSLIQQCRLLFITDHNASSVKQVLRKTSFFQVLTVSSLPGFAGLGGMIELSRENGRFAFLINLSVVKESDIELSSSLLEISSIIKGDSS